jgi:hypothetical protein
MGVPDFSLARMLSIPEEPLSMGLSLVHNLIAEIDALITNRNIVLPGN